MKNRRINRSFLIVFLQLAFTSLAGYGQTDLRFGLELDALPYATGGYFVAAWAGQGHVRVRTLLTKVNMPEFAIQKGFTNQTITSVAIIGDYFPKEGFKGWWFGGGPVYWKGTIQSEQELVKAKFDSFLLNGSVGYCFDLGQRFYVGPWTGLSLRFGGPKEVQVDDQTFKPRILNPELSVKLGFRL